MQMEDVDHTNPYTDRPFGETVAFERGVVAADGGRPDADDDRTMAEVSHTPPHGEGAMRAFERGTEGRADTV
jgi:hypothetical protein